MSLFWNHLGQYTFLRHALLAGLLASLACGTIGSYIVVRRTTYVAGAIAHSVLGGLGAARYFQQVHGIGWMTPLLGATAAAVSAALVIALVTLSGREREDTVLSAIWAIGMATGVSFIAATPGYYEDLMSYLFGNILMVGKGDLQLIAMLDAVILGTTILFHDKFLVIGFQPEIARLRGLRVGFYHTLLLLLTALTVVLLTQVVGLVLVIALLTLPAATAAHFVSRLWQMIVVAVVLSALFVTGGLAVSYGPELPAGPTVIQLAATVYLLVVVSKWLVGRGRSRAREG